MPGTAPGSYSLWRIFLLVGPLSTVVILIWSRVAFPSRAPLAISDALRSFGRLLLSWMPFTYARARGLIMLSRHCFCLYFDYTRHIFDPISPISSRIISPYTLYEFIPEEEFVFPFYCSCSRLLWRKFWPVRNFGVKVFVFIAIYYKFRSFFNKHYYKTYQLYFRRDFISLVFRLDFYRWKLVLVFIYFLYGIICKMINLIILIYFITARRTDKLTSYLYNMHIHL